MDYHVIMNIRRENQEAFEFLSNQILGRLQLLKYYRAFYPRSEKSIYAFIKDTSGVQQAGFSAILYDTVKESEDFNLAEFTLIMVNAIPRYSGFDAADEFMSFFIDHLQELSVDDIDAVMSVYRSNGQCINRGRHSADNTIVKNYIKDHTGASDDEVSGEKESEATKVNLEE